MAVPKYRPSSQRQGRRRKQHQQNLPEISNCPHCGALKMPHFACPSCGKYNLAKGKKPMAEGKRQKAEGEKKNDKTKKEKRSKT